jgi:ABC-type oligopeptide transport system ATPase subunit
MSDHALIDVEDLRCLFPIRRNLGDIARGRSHNVHAVDSVSFSMQRGEILALVG